MQNYDLRGGFQDSKQIGYFLSDLDCEDNIRMCHVIIGRHVMLTVDMFVVVFLL